MGDSEEINWKIHVSRPSRSHDLEYLNLLPKNYIKNVVFHLGIYMRRFDTIMQSLVNKFLILPKFMLITLFKIEKAICSLTLIVLTFFSKHITCIITLNVIYIMKKK